jgi:hypothetical protein
MAGEREINFGADATDAQWRIADDSTSGNFVLAEDLDGSTVLLEYDTTNNEWVSRGPVNLGGNNLTTTGTVDAGTVRMRALRYERNPQMTCQRPRRRSTQMNP